MSKLTYQQIKGRRAKKGIFWYVTTFDRAPNGERWYWCPTQKKWVDYGPTECCRRGHADSGKGHYHSSHCDICIRSTRGFCRRLREWSTYLPAGVKFILPSRYLHDDVYGHTK